VDLEVPALPAGLLPVIAAAAGHLHPIVLPAEALTVLPAGVLTAAQVIRTIHLLRPLPIAAQVLG